MAKTRTSFRPGISGNPGGRPKVAHDLQELARTHTPEAFSTVVEIMRAGNNNEKLRAAEIIMERGYGKPIQPQHHTGSVDLKLADELNNAIERVRAYRQSREPSTH
jgi:Family of unknown function (DUF5681)